MFNWMPENVSTYGGALDGLIALIFYIIIPWFIVSEAILFAFIFMYRRKKGRKAHYEAGKTGKALAWILIPAALVLCFDLAIDAKGATVWKTIKQTLPEKALRVKVEAGQFYWKFTHPGPDNELGTSDDLVSDSNMHVPINEPVIFELESKDVIHSFFVPNLRVKQDVVPGRRILGWFEANKAGTYEIACAELCGLGHTKMRGWLNVHSAEDYAAWQAQAVKEKEEAGGDDFWE